MTGVQTCALPISKLLNLTTDKAHHFLGWAPAWNFEQTMAKTTEWYLQAVSAPERAPSLTRTDIENYTLAARTGNVRWAG